MQEEIKEVILELESIIERAENIKQRLQSEQLPNEESASAMGVKLLVMRREFEGRIKALEDSGKKVKQWKAEVRKPKHYVSFCRQLILLMVVWWISYGFATRVSDLFKCDCSPSPQ